MAVASARGKRLYPSMPQVHPTPSRGAQLCMSRKIVPPSTTPRTPTHPLSQIFFQPNRHLKRIRPTRHRQLVGSLDRDRHRLARHPHHKTRRPNPTRPLPAMAPICHNAPPHTFPPLARHSRHRSSRNLKSIPSPINPKNPSTYLELIL